jgi:hypothetical protein
MNSISAFFTKYSLHINIILLLFWLFILYDDYISGNFKLGKIIIPILFIVMSLFNIYKALKSPNK